MRSNRRYRPVRCTSDISDAYPTATATTTRLPPNRQRMEIMKSFQAAPIRRA